MEWHDNLHAATGPDFCDSCAHHDERLRPGQAARVMKAAGEVPKKHQSVEDWEAIFTSGPFRKHMNSSDAAVPLVIQFGSEQCALCPQATLYLDGASKTHHFVWEYEDVFTSESGLAEELNVTALPALLVFHDADRFTLYQKLRGTEVLDVIKEHCVPRLVLDEEF